ncbi:MAG: arylsulfotransferase family protein, partial [Bdellovibrionia bacterium]
LSEPAGIHDDVIAKVSSSGEILQSESMLKLLIEKQLRHWVITYDEIVSFPVGIRDIQPVLADGPYWKRGDLFLSLGSLNMVLLYRPATREIVWSTRDGLETPGDVEILDDHRISIFDSNRWFPPGNGNWAFAPADVPVYSFKAKKYQRPFKDALEKRNVESNGEELAKVLPNGNLYLETGARAG